MDIGAQSLEYHKKFKGKIAIKSKSMIETKADLSLAYTPGVAHVCTEIAKNPDLAYETTLKSNSVAVVSNGSRVLGLGNIGALASIPVMEGKAMLFKEFGNVDAYPICLDLKDEEEIIRTVKALAPVFGGINLEDIENPKCYSIEKRLIEELDIPVMHDDQHGTAVITLAGVQNALKLASKKIETAKIVVMGAGAAGSAISLLLARAGCKQVLCSDRSGVLSTARKDLDEHKLLVANATNSKQDMSFEKACVGADVLIGASAPGSIKQENIRSMNSKPIVFALANPTPEISHADAISAGAFIYASGRSDLPNQINNVLAFPGIFRGALDVRAKKITENMKIAAANAISKSISEKELTQNNIIPAPFDKSVHFNVALAVAKAAQKDKVARVHVPEKELEALIKKNIEKK